LGKEVAAIGRPAETVDGVGKRGVGEIEFGIEFAFFFGDRFFVAVDEDGVFVDGEFRAFEDAAAFSARVLNPDVVVLEIVFFVVNIAADAKGDAAVGGDGERGEFFVDGEGGFVELLSGSDARKEKTRNNTEDTEAKSTEDKEKRENKTRINTEGTEAECIEDTEKRKTEKRKMEKRKTEKRKERV